MTGQKSVESINVIEAKAKLEAGAVAIDTAPISSWAGGHVPDSLSMPMESISFRYTELPEEAVLVFFSEDGTKSFAAAEKALTLGFGEVYNVNGGTRAWLAAGYEMEAFGSRIM